MCLDVWIFYITCGLIYTKDFAPACCKLFLKSQIFLFFQGSNYQRLAKLYLIFARFLLNVCN